MGLKTLYSTPSAKQIVPPSAQSAKAFAIAGESSAVPLLEAYWEGTSQVLYCVVGAAEAASAKQEAKNEARGFGILNNESK